MHTNIKVTLLYERSVKNTNNAYSSHYYHQHRSRLNRALLVLLQTQQKMKHKNSVEFHCRKNVTAAAVYMQFQVDGNERKSKHSTNTYSF